MAGYHDPPAYVARELLIGKALLIYWPHAWRGPFHCRSCRISPGWG